MKRILVTGANGFVGQVLCMALLEAGYFVRGAVRHFSNIPFEIRSKSSVEFISIDDIGPETDWTRALKGVDAVVHLAALAHIMKEYLKDSLIEYRRVNADGTKRLAQAAAQTGVQRMLYISTIKVNGEFTTDIPFTEDAEPAPQDPYAISKLEAEQVLQSIAAKTGLEFVILRPPIVYGPGVGANFLKLMKLICSGIPLPFASMKNSRSLVYVWNLADAIVRCIQHPSATDKIFLVSDGENLSTPDLIRRLATALGKPARLVPFPPALLRLAGGLAGRSAEVERLVRSLEIDSTKIRNELNWNPPFKINHGLKLTAEWYIAHEKSL